MDLRPLWLPADSGASAHGRLILRDGATALLRVAGPEDAPALVRFYQGMSPDALHRRFLSVTPPGLAFALEQCRPRPPQEGLTLVAERTVDGHREIVATGSYLAVGERAAEVAFAVADAFQGKGFATLLLERLALGAARAGLLRLVAVTEPGNRAMLDVFGESGWPLRTEPDQDLVTVSIDLRPGPGTVERHDRRDRIATVASLRPLFVPSGVVVVGASFDPAAIGHRVLRALLDGGFRGPVWAVNPKGGELLGQQVFRSVRELPQAPDLAVVVVPAAAVLAAVDDCAARGVRALVVISAGFAEVGAAGQALQDELVARVRGHGMRMVGPNCLGLMHAAPDVRLYASFAPMRPASGRIAVASQSGAVGMAVLQRAADLGLGLSGFVSLGNKADVSGNDLVQWWEEDPATGVILLYLESFGNPRRFGQLARRVGQRKPIVVLKAGRSAAGARAVSSHTAALAGSDVAVDVLLRSAGVLRARTLEEFPGLGGLLAAQPAPAGPRVALVTNAGGPAILCVDACEGEGLLVPELATATQAALRSYLPAAASVHNPVDLVASAGPEQFQRAVADVLADPGIDAVIVLWARVTDVGGAPAEAGLLRAIGDGVVAGRGRGGVGKPVVFVPLLLRPDPVRAGAETVPAFATPEEAALALARAWQWAQAQARPVGQVREFQGLQVDLARAVVTQARAAHGPGWLSADEVRAVLGAFGIPQAPGGVARDPEAAVALARKVGFPVALKLASRTLVHKTELHGVALDLPDEAAVRAAFPRLLERLAPARREPLDGILVQPMVRGVEVMAGATVDQSFGPLLAFGLGGIHVELLRDVSFRLAPLSDQDAFDMMRGLRGFPLLEGYRGHAPADLPALAELLQRLSRLMEEVPEIAELDLNPVMALPPGEGCVVVDARVRCG